MAKMADTAVEAVDRLHNMNGLRPLLDKIDALESEGDAIYRKSLGRLFSGELEALEVIKWKDIIESGRGCHRPAGGRGRLHRLHPREARLTRPMTMGAVLTIVVALIFDFTNGFHDSANSIATVVCTRVLSPRYAVLWAAAFNFIAFLIFKTAVASTIAKGVVTQDILTVGRDLRRPGRRDRLEPHHLLPGLAHVVVARVGGRHRRRRHRPGRRPRAARRRAAQDRRVHRAGAAHRPGAGPHHHDGHPVDVLQGEEAGSAQPGLPARPAAVGRGVLSSATAATTPRRRWASSSPCSSPRGRWPGTATSRCGSCSRPTPPSAWARSWAAGAS